MLNGFKLKYVAVYDRDHQEHKSADAISSADNSTQKIETVIDDEFGKSIIFENDIEEEIGITEKSNKNKPFLALDKVSNSDYEIPEVLRTKILEIYE